MSTTRNQDSSSLGAIYGDMLNTVKKNIIKESSSKIKAGEIGESPLIKGGPQTTAGYMSAKIDRRTMSKKELDDNLYNIKDLSEEDEEMKDEDAEGKKAKKGTFTKIEKAAEKSGYSKKAAQKIAGAAKAKIKGTYSKEEDEESQKVSGKIVRESLNNFMARKSVFDKLYENVMGMDQSEEGNDLSALGIEPEGEGMEGGEDEVTLTLDRETAQKLIDVLSASLGGDTESGEGEDEYGGEETESDEDAESFYFGEEDEEDEGEPATASTSINYGKQNKVGTLKVQKQAVTGKTTDKVGYDGDYGHALVNAKQPNMGKDNKIQSVHRHVGKSAFEV